MIKKLIYLAGSVLLLALMVFALYATCITEVQKTWLDLDAGASFGHITEPLYEGNAYCQHFIAQRSQVDEMLLRIITWNREYSKEDQLTASIIADSTGETVAECRIPLTDVVDKQLYALPLSGIHLDKGAWYTLQLSGNATEEEHSVSLMLSDRGADMWEYCVHNEKEEPMDYDLSIIIRGRGMF